MKKLYINSRKSRTKLSPTSFNPCRVYDASDMDEAGSVEFVESNTVIDFIRTVSKCSDDDLSSAAKRIIEEYESK